MVYMTVLVKAQLHRSSYGCDLSRQSSLTFNCPASTAKQFSAMPRHLLRSLVQCGGSHLLNTYVGYARQAEHYRTAFVRSRDVVYSMRMRQCICLATIIAKSKMRIICH